MEPESIKRTGELLLVHWETKGTRGKNMKNQHETTTIFSAGCIVVPKNVIITTDLYAHSLILYISRLSFPKPALAGKVMIATKPSLNAMLTREVQCSKAPSPI